METNIELEEMRSQLGLLKDKLDKEVLVSNQMLRSAMRDRTSRLNRTILVQVVAAVLVCITIPPFAKDNGISMWFVVYSLFMMIVSTFFTFWYHRGIKPDMMNGNMLDVAQRMRKLRGDYNRWPLIGYPMAGLWIIWLVWELSRNYAVDPAHVMGILVGVVLGFAVGGVIGYHHNKQNLKIIDQLINDAELLMEENK